VDIDEAWAVRTRWGEQVIETMLETSVTTLSGKVGVVKGKVGGCEMQITQKLTQNQGGTIHWYLRVAF
jgi:hypothetical protein